MFRNEVAIGIDLGTAYSRVAVWRNDKVEMITDSQGNIKIPNYIAFGGTEYVFGTEASNLIDTNVKNTIFSVKRLLDRKFDHVLVKKDIEHNWPFKVIDTEGKPKIVVEFKGEVKHFNPEEICALILAKLKGIAEEYLGVKVTHAVISVSALSGIFQRSAIVSAGTVAGLDVLKVLGAPVATAVAYEVNNLSEIDDDEEARHVLIIDLGAGTLDVAIVLMDHGFIQVVATEGDNYFGGEDFLNRFLNRFGQEIKRKTKVDIWKDPVVFCKVREACEQAKRNLSSNLNAHFDVDVGQGIQVCGHFSRKEFEKMSKHLRRLIWEPVKRALIVAKENEIPDISDVVINGGSTKMPKIGEKLEKVLGQHLVKATVEESVAYGAAVHAAKLIGDRSLAHKDIFVLDVTPHSFGVERKDGTMHPIIKRTTTIPTKWIHSFKYSDLPESGSNIIIKIFEGDSLNTKDNVFLSALNFPKRSKPVSGEGEVPQIEITFALNLDWTLEVTAVDKSINQTKKVTIP